VAAFRFIPYFARTHINIPPLEDLLDVSLARLRELEATTFADTDEYFETNNADNDPQSDEED
jgi:hypothetical protein